MKRPHKYETLPEQIERKIERDNAEWSALGFVLILACVFVLAMGWVMR